MSPPRTALPGQKFGTLTVVREGPPATTGVRRVLCECECGRHGLVRAANLVSGNTRTCGFPPCRNRGGPGPPPHVGALLRARAGYREPGAQARNFIFKSYRSTARRKHREWDLTFDRFCDLTAQDCRYCGAPPSNRTKDKNGDGVFVYSGLDRVDASRGYTEDNVVPACIACNRAKNDMSRDEFYAWVGRVASRVRQRR